MPDEVALGGNLQDAVRIGDTVHRRAGPWTPAVHALLRYLESAGFPAPRVVGMDGQGREVLRFIAGDVDAGGDRPMSDAFWTDQCVAEAGRLLRRYHDVVAQFRPPPNARWRYVAPTSYELICHNDWAPWNTLMRDGHVAVMLDWDLAGPGTRLWDIATAVYEWAPLFVGYKNPKIEDRRRRLKLFVDSYGLADRSELLLTLRMRLQHMGAFVEAEARAGDIGMRRLVDANWSARRAEELAYLDANWAALERAL